MHNKFNSKTQSVEIFLFKSEEEKKGRRKLRMTKRKKTSDKRNEEKDRLSNLPEAVLLHIMEFLPTKQAVQSCVLSKRWKNLWKSLSTLSFFPSASGIRKYNKFVSHVLSNRDHCVALHNLRLTVFKSTVPKLLSKAINYAASHYLSKLTLDFDFEVKEIPTSIVTLLYNSKYLTFLDIRINICISFYCCTMKLPQSFDLPSLKILVLNNVTFTGGADNCADPFSACTSLTTLILRHYIHNYSAQTLHISCPSLSTLKLHNIVHSHTFVPKIVLSVPNLRSITLENCGFFTCYELSSKCGLPFIEEVKINNRVTVESSIIIDWLRMFSNVRTLTLCSRTLITIMKVRYFILFSLIILSMFNLTF